MVKRIIYPPVWLLLGLIIIFTCNEYFAGPRFTSLSGQLFGGGVLVVGLRLLLSAGGLFSRAKTCLIPFRDVSALVTGGVYRYTRNPMYLGMLAVLLGCAVTVGASVALLVPVMFAVIIEWRFIRPEEALLRDIFPEQFAAYCGRVRRWV